MTSPQKARAKIMVPELAEVLVTAVSQAAEINVTTSIVKELDNPKFSEQRFSTQINLVDCTVNNEIDLQLIDNPAYGELQRWHIEQVKHKQASLVGNVASLESMLRIIDCEVSSD